MEVEEGKLEEELVDKPGTTIGTKFSVLHRIRIPFLNEMWFLTVDPLVRISVFIAKLSERQDCWRILEDFIVKNISNSLTYTIASSCVCTSPLAVMTIVGLLDVVTVSNSAEFTFFANNVHQRTGVYNKFSFLWFNG